MPQYNFSEAFLQLLWQVSAFDLQDLKTTAGNSLQISSPGILNSASGPDFEEAQLQLDGLAWNGAVEIHIRSSDWYRHQHQKDKAYEQVILHVVYEHDQEVEVGAGRVLPTLELKNRISPQLLQQSEALLNENREIPCGQQANILSDLEREAWLSRLAAERMEAKIQAIQNRLEQTKNDWAEVFYLQLARSFGLLHNAEPMEQLARILPLKLITKLQLWQVEALAFGQAGWLQGNFKEAYPNKLKKEYHFLQKQYGLEPMLAHSWKWSGMRPSSFPSLRVAMLIRLLRQQPQLFSKLLEARPIKSLWPLFKIELDGYWEKHYRLDQPGKGAHKKRLTKSFFEKLAINALLPVLFAYGKSRGQAMLCERALDGLADLAAEQHGLLRAWSDLGLKAQTAKEAQALLQLKKQYCAQKRCLECRIGQRLILGD
jgi:hypothetical protein